MSQYTDAQIYAAISAALRADDMPAVVSLITRLALQNPTEADVLRRSILALTEAEATP